jgi:hypothetical protein
MKIIKFLFFSFLFLIFGSVNVFIGMELFVCHNQMSELKIMIATKEKNMENFRKKMIDPQLSENKESKMLSNSN